MVLKRFTTGLVAAAVAAVAASSASAAPPDIQTKPFNVAGMASNIESRLGGVTGYAYAIAKDGKLAASNAGGKARTGPDGDLDMTTSTRMEIWSATKTYTAAATLKLLEAHPTATLDGPVSAFLPAGWTRGLGFRFTDPPKMRVTFRELLNHTSGLGQVGETLTQNEKDTNVWNTTWAGNQYAVQRGTLAGSPYNYTNMNYALLRVLNARLWRDLEPQNVPVQDATNTGFLNQAYINRDLLQPAGVSWARCWAADTSPVLHYRATAPTSPGALVELNGDSRQACAGHRGLHLSAIDMLRFMVYLQHGSIVSANVRDLMDSGRLGWDANSNTNAGNAGVYWHRGDGFPDTGVVGAGREGHTCQMKFPNSMQATLIVNSTLTGVGTTQCGVLLQAWQAAQ